jgi:AraC-like DNA-binding protein
MQDRHLEESCRDWVAGSEAYGGLQRLQAWFAGAAFARHRHDTYAIGVTNAGVQCFWYRGSVHSSTPGEVVVLHPDEVHDGFAGTSQGFGYRILYVEPARVLEACRAIAGRACALPFAPRPVLKSRRLRALVEAAFAADGEPLAPDTIILGLTGALLAEAGEPAFAPPRVDKQAVDRARQLLDSAIGRLVHSSELEAACGLSRFELARQFRAHTGTSPHRYSMMRRLEWARERLGEKPLVDLALDAAFADQAHFTRAFKAAFGVTPGRYVELKDVTSG